MKKLSLAIIEKDEEYLKALSNYLSSNHFKEFVITAISDEEYFNKFLETVRGIDVVLINENIFDDRLKDKFISKIIILGENRQKEGLDYIYKYQIASSIYKKIKNSYIESNPGANKYDDFEDKMSKITACYSPIGGIGKTSVALSIALKLNEKSRNVIYINFEDIPCMENFFDCSSTNSMSEMLYLAKDRSPQLKDKINQNILTDKSGVCYFNPINTVLDLETINRDDIIYFMDELKNLNKFDNIIIDMGSKFNSLYGGILSACDNVIVLVGSDGISKIKINNFLKQQESIDNYLFIVNKYKNEEINMPEQIEKYNKSILAKINYYAEMDGNINGVETYKENNQFVVSINEIIQKIFMN